jgi:arylsulfatase A-like enzyme
MTSRLRPHRYLLSCLVILLSLSAYPLSAAEQPASKPTRTPNILFAIADDWSPHAGAYGTKWVNTPAFDRVAREGMLFTHAYTPDAKCAPSRACILTGRNPWQLKEAANHICYFPAEFKGWGEALAEHGWTVGHTQKGWGPGVANDADGKPRLMTGKPFNKRTAKPPATGISNNDYAANFTDFLDAAPADKPWCFWYGSVEPHRGYEFGSGVAKGGKKLSDIDHVPAAWPDNDTIRNDMLDYGFEVEHFDRHLGRMLAELEKRGLLDNTLVIATSDHGMPFPRGKGSSYDLSNRVPLAIMWKGGGVKPGRTIDDYVSFIDVAPTLMEVAGIKWADSGMAPTTGRSWMELFRSDKSGRVIEARDHVLLGRERNDIGRPHDQGYPIRGIVKGDTLYLQNFEPTRWPAGNPETGYLDVDGGPTKTFILAAHRQNAADAFWALCFGKRPADELYDLKKDPDCVHNLTSDPGTATQMAALRDQMYAELQKQEDPRMAGMGAQFDEYLHANKAHVGFYERYMAGEKLNTGWVNPSDYESKPVKPQK